MSVSVRLYALTGKGEAEGARRRTRRVERVFVGRERFAEQRAAHGLKLAPLLVTKSHREDDPSHTCRIPFVIEVEVDLRDRDLAPARSPRAFETVCKFESRCRLADAREGAVSSPDYSRALTEEGH